MKTPYQILEVTAGADDSEIRQAYLQKVKNNPPDADQEKFREIQAAYESIKDYRSRIRYELFHEQTLDFDALLDQAFGTDQPRQIDHDQFIDLLRAGLEAIELESITIEPEKT